MFSLTLSQFARIGERTKSWERMKRLIPKDKLAQELNNPLAGVPPTYPPFSTTMDKRWAVVSVSIVGIASVLSFMAELSEKNTWTRHPL